MKNKLRGFILILLIAVVIYNMSLFLLAGFADHEASFWVSWVFMTIAFAATLGGLLILGSKAFFLRDWLFGYPFVKYSVLYLLLEFVVSILFMCLDGISAWQWAFVVQFLLLALYGIVFIACAIAKDTIKNVDLKISDKTRFIRLLKADAEMLEEKCGDATLKSRCREFAEAVRYSDPISSDALFALEKEITLTVTECDKAIVAADYAVASELCEKALLLLTERNKKTKALK